MLTNQLKQLARRSHTLSQTFRFCRSRYERWRMSRHPDTIEINGKKLWIGGDVGMKKNYLRPDYFDSFEEAMEATVEPGSQVLDVGAHLGVTAVLLSDRVGPTGKVYAFEPSPSNLMVLEQNISSNNIQNIDVVPYAVSSETGTLSLFINKIHTGFNSINRESALECYHLQGDLEEVEVPVTTLDLFISEHNITPDWIKIDCQGAELQILRGASSLLAAGGIQPVVYLEFWPLGIRRFGDDPGALLQLLFSHGYVLANQATLPEWVERPDLTDAQIEPFLSWVDAQPGGLSNLLFTAGAS